MQNCEYQFLWKTQNGNGQFSSFFKAQKVEKLKKILLTAGNLIRTAKFNKANKKTSPT